MDNDDQEPDAYMKALVAAEVTRFAAIKAGWSAEGAEDLGKVVHMAELAQLLGVDLSETS